MKEPTILIDQQDPALAIITMHRPQKRNALNIQLLEELLAALQSLPKKVRGIVLAGEGPAFCTGMDLNECSAPTDAEQSAYLLGRVFETLATIPAVTVAAVHGYTFAGGAGLLLACDGAVGAHDLQIAFPETQRGLVPAQVITLMRHRLRPSDMYNLLLFNQNLDAVHAIQSGLIQKAVPLQDLLHEACGFVRQALLGAPEAVRLTKNLLSGVDPLHLHDELEAATALQLRVRLSPEAIEGSSAFLEKRAPSWTAFQNVED